MPQKDLNTFLLPNNPLTLTSASFSTTSNLSPTFDSSISSTTNNKKGAGTKKVAVNPDLLVPTVKKSKSSGETLISLPHFGNLQINTGSDLPTVISQDSGNFPRGFAKNLSRGEFGGFQCTSRGGSRLMALPGMKQQQKQQKQEQQEVAATSASSNENVATAASVDSSYQGPNKTLKDIWKFGMRAKAPLLCEIDPTSIGRPFVQQQKTENENSSEIKPCTCDNNNNNNNESSKNKEEEKVRIVRIRPEFLFRGAVQPPQAEVVEVNKTLLDDDSGHLMTPLQRKDLLETQRRAREGLVALREVRGAKTKLSRTCQKLYPHGGLGILDGPYSEHPDEDAYQTISHQLKQEDVKVARKGRKDAGPFARPHETKELVLNVAKNNNTSNKNKNISTTANNIFGQQPEILTAPLEGEKKRGLKVKGVEARPKDSIKNLVGF